MNNTVNETPNVLVRLKYYPQGNGGGYSGRRSFYASGGADDYMKYIEKGIAGGETAKPDYMDYVGSGVKGDGLFGADGILSKELKAEIRKQLRETGGNVWDMVISFKEGYGDRHMRDTATAQGLLKARLNKFFKAAGLNPDNTVWFAGLHTNTDNAHVHACFFEREPVFLRRGKEGKHYHQGKLRQAGIDGLKVGIEQYFSDTAMQLKADRAELIAAARESVNYDKQIKDKISALAELLSPIFKLNYDSDRVYPLRPRINGITDHIIRHYAPARDAYLKMSGTLRKRDDETVAICDRQKIKNVGAFLVHDKVMEDLYRRIGNQVIDFAFNVRQRRDRDKWAREGNAKPYIRRAARRRFLTSLRNCLKLKAIAETECLRDFKDYLKRLEAAKPEAKYEKDEPHLEKEEACMD